MQQAANSNYQWTVLDAVLCMQLTLEHHGTEEKVRDCLQSLEKQQYGHGYTHLPLRMAELNGCANVVAEVDHVCSSYYKAQVEAASQFEEFLEEEPVE